MLFALGNEIPPSVVRWYGRQRIERFLQDLYDDAKAAAPDALLTYVNYPPTEYLETPFFDVCAFNVFLHSEEELSAYLARLHHIAGLAPAARSRSSAPTVSGTARQGQAALVRMQLRTALREGACGAVVFTWTDDWWRGGRAVDDWAFGLVDAERRTEAGVSRPCSASSASPRASTRAPTPRVSVVVCAYNAAATIDECLDALEQRELSGLRGHRRQRRVDGRHRRCRGAPSVCPRHQHAERRARQPHATSVSTTRPARSSPTPTPTCASIPSG